MKGKIIPLFSAFLLTTPVCQAQEHKCELLSAIGEYSKKEIVINRDTIFFENTPQLKLYLINDKIYANKKVIHKFKKVSWYAEISYLKIESATYIYVYPIHKGQSGPYIWELNNGVAIQVSNVLPVRKNIPYADFFEICDLNIENYFQEEKKKQ